MIKFNEGKSYGNGRFTVIRIKKLSSPMQTSNGKMIGLVRYEYLGTSFHTALFEEDNREYFYAYSFNHQKVWAAQ